MHCPFCGIEDEGKHMSVALDGRGWRCFRRHDHRGKSPVRLIMGLLGCTREYALSLVGGVYIPDDFAATVNALMAPPAMSGSRKRLRLPETFKPIGELPSARMYRGYLREDRGFTERQINRMSSQYGMLYCTQGAFKGRIIFPVVCDGRLVSWTGRSIYETAILRYKAMSHEEEKARDEGFPVPAVGPISHYLLWYDMLMDCDADTICLVEGPFDALKIDVLAYGAGVCATCFFTSGPTGAQIELLHDLLPRFKHRVLLLDQGTLPNAIRIQRDLAGLGVRVRELVGVKDPGAITTRRGLMKFLVDDSRGID